LISDGEAKKRALVYAKKGEGCFIYHGVSDIFGKRKWYVHTTFFT